MAECGPMRLRIWAWVGRLAQPQEAIRAAGESIGFLEQVSADRYLLKDPWGSVCKERLQYLGRAMWESVAMVGDPDLTPMASVAGTIADSVADLLAGRGMTRVIVENGGDVALRLTQGETVAVGIRPRVEKGRLTHRLRLEGSSPSWGVATSGLGGRSLTRGIAWSATVLAQRASVADAAATAVANATWVPCQQVERVRAEQLDPDSDIAGLEVTLRVGELPREVASKGLEQGLARAESLRAKGVIKGAFLCVGSLWGSVGLGKLLEQA
ncbi:MAG: UPF0280 family protein [bacterium]